MFLAGTRTFLPQCREWLKWNFSISSPESSSLLTSWHLNGYNGLNTGWLVDSMVSNFAESETVMVASAGNQGLPYAGYPGHFAVHTDEAGNLTFDGRIIVAGSYDAKKGDLASYSNAAGTLCTTDSCNTDYRISDFYLMAPGSFVASTSVGGGYEVKTGTSMAAPVTWCCRGSSQMWPHMTGANRKLLLETGDTSFAGYNVHRHGWVYSIWMRYQPNWGIGHSDYRPCQWRQPVTLVRSA